MHLGHFVNASSLEKYQHVKDVTVNYRKTKQIFSKDPSKDRDAMVLGQVGRQRKETCSKGKVPRSCVLQMWWPRTYGTTVSFSKIQWECVRKGHCIQKKRKMKGRWKENNRTWKENKGKLKKKTKTGNSGNFKRVKGKWQEINERKISKKCKER